MADNDQADDAYDALLKTTKGKGTRKEMGQVRRDGFRRPKDQTGWPIGKGKR